LDQGKLDMIASDRTLTNTRQLAQY
jgi:hypothetical protein